MGGVDRVRETRLSPHCSESSHCAARARAAVTEGSRRRAVPGQSGHCPREVTPGRSPSGRAVSGFDEPYQDPGPAWRLPVSSGSAGRGLTSTWITAASPGWAARSEARTPAHRFTPSGSGTSSSWTGSAPYSHAEMGIFSSRMSMHRMAYSLTARGLCLGSPRSIFYRSDRKSDRRIGAPKSSVGHARDSAQISRLRRGLWRVTRAVIAGGAGTRCLFWKSATW